MPDPIVTRLPETTRAVENKYRNNPDLLTGYDSPVSQAILNLDIERAQRGQNPLSVGQTQIGLRAAQTRQAVTKPPDKPFWQDAIDDIRAITTAIPRLPLAMYREANELPNIGENISKAMAEEGLVNQISALGNVPGLRLIPGSFIASNLNNPGELANHPVMTFLDILPGLQKAGVTGAIGDFAKPKLAPVGRKLGATMPGQYFQGAFGKKARDSMQLRNQKNTRLADAAGNERPLHKVSDDPQVQAIAEITRQGREIREKYNDIAEDRRMELGRLAQEDSLAIRTLPPREQAFLYDYNEATKRIGHYGVYDQGMLAMLDNEIYDLATAKRIVGADQKAKKYTLFDDVRQSIETRTANIDNMLNNHGVASTLVSEGLPPSGWVNETQFTEMGAELETALQRGKSHYETLLDNYGVTSKEAPSLKSAIENHDLALNYIRDLRNPIPTILEKINDVTVNEFLSKQDKLALLKGYAHAIDSAGYDAAPIRSIINDINNPKKPGIKYDDEYVRDRVSQVADTIQPRVNPTPAVLDDATKKVFGFEGAQMTQHGVWGQLSGGGLPTTGWIDETGKITDQFIELHPQLLTELQDGLAKWESAYENASGFAKTPKWVVDRTARAVEDFKEWIAATEKARDSIPEAAFDLKSFMESVAKQARTDVQIAKLLDHIKAGRWSEAKKVGGNINRRGKFAIPDIDKAIDEIVRQRERNKYLRQTSKYNTKNTAKAQATAANRRAANPPARFMPTIDKMVSDTLKARYSTSPDFDKIIQYLDEHNYSFLDKEGLIPEAEVRQLSIDMRKTWQDLKSAGHDPMFVHQIHESQVINIQHPTILEKVPTPSQVQKRSWNMGPTVADPTVALTHQGLEWLIRQGSEEFVDEFIKAYSKTEHELKADYLAAARVRAKTPRDVDAIVNRMMAKEWMKFDPQDIITWQTPKTKRWNAEKIWVPKYLGDNIRRMHTPPGGRLSTTVDPVMKVFRTALLPLSLRWHVYNIMGGGLMLMAGTDPTVFRFLDQARKMVKEGNIPDDIPAGYATIGRNIVEYDTRKSLVKPLEDVFHIKGAATMRRWLEEVQEARNKTGKVIDKSYAINGMFDDTYRVMAYLYGKDKAGRKGALSAADQHKAGVTLARKVFQEWDRMTPLERTVMRFVFPFYGWTAHVMKFVMQYPFDHPIRTAIVGSFARNELEDMGTGLPQRFMNMFFLGDMDKNGNVKAVNIGGMNPFGDVANNFTLAGFLGQANPIISTVAQTFGVDVGNGGPELFPNMQYDPETGRLRYKSRNPLAIFAESILPPARVLTGMADSSSEFQQLLRTNPEAAGRLLMSQAGLPLIYRPQVNIPQEIVKAEIARDEAQSTALNESLKSGDWSEAERFPNLAPILDNMRRLQESGDLDPYTPESAGQSAISMAQKALLSNFVPIPKPTPVLPGQQP